MTAAPVPRGVSSRAASRVSRLIVLAAHRQHGGTLPYNTDGIITRGLVGDGFLHVLRPEGKPSCTQITGAGLEYLALSEEYARPVTSARRRHGLTVDQVLDGDACRSFGRKDWAALALGALERAGLTPEQQRSMREALGRLGMDVP